MPILSGHLRDRTVWCARRLTELAGRLRGDYRLVPPPALRERVGPFRDNPGLYVAMRHEYLQLLVSRGGLLPGDRVLDVGCGSGMMAAALTEYLSTGSYEGFDPDQDLIRWCNAHITRRFPRFRFLAVSVEKYADPRAPCRSSQFTFPYGEGAFDYVILKSVFTHMFPDGIERYLSEICRVLRRNGRVFATHYILSEAMLRLMESGLSRWQFRFDHGSYRAVDDRDTLKLVAHGESYLLDLYERHGLRIEPPILFGGWHRNEPTPVGQDSIIAVKL